MNSAVILAGGLGTRLRSVLPDIPKPMAPINGRPFLEILIDYWITQGIKKFILSVCYRHEVIINHFGNNYNGALIEYVIENEPLGTGGALMLASKKLSCNQPFLLLNGDTFFEIDFNLLKNTYKKNNADWCFSLFRIGENSRYMSMELSNLGVIKSLNSGFSKHDTLVNGGVYLVNPLALRFNNTSKIIIHSLEDNIFPHAMSIGQKMIGQEFNGLFIDIGIPEDYTKAQLIFG